MYTCPYLYPFISFRNGLVNMLLRDNAAAITRHSSRQSNTYPSNRSFPRRALIGRDSSTCPTNVRSPLCGLTEPLREIVMAPSCVWRGEGGDGGGRGGGRRKRRGEEEGKEERRRGGGRGRGGGGGEEKEVEEKVENIMVGEEEEK